TLSRSARYVLRAARTRGTGARSAMPWLSRAGSGAPRSFGDGGASARRPCPEPVALAREQGPRVRGDGRGASVRRSRWLLPPAIALVAIVTMIVLHIFMPIAIVVRAPGPYADVLVVATGVAMIVWSRRAFQAAGTPIKPFTESTELL